jgi:hypothetical protein
MIKEPGRVRAGGCVAVRVGAGDGLASSADASVVRDVPVRPTDVAAPSGLR